MSGSFPCHTHYYANFFVLRLDVHLNRLPVKLNLSSGRQVQICGQQENIVLSVDSVARTVQGCLRVYGYHIINIVMYGGDAPLFQIDTSQSFSLKVLIAQLPNIDTELETALRAELPASTEDIDCKVMTKVGLICPNTAKKDADIILVTEDNMVLCWDMWKESIVFEFHKVFQYMREGQTSHSLNSALKLTLPKLVEELVDVVDWFTFGVHLGVPHSELMKIRADYPDVDHRKVQTLSVYLKTNIERWYDIVRALIGIREIRLAEHIATKYGVPLQQLHKREDFNSNIAIVFEKGNKLQLELMVTIKEVENDVEAQEDRLALKDRELLALEMEFNKAKRRGSATRAKVVKMRDEAKALEREKEQLQKEMKRMEYEIRTLKRMQNLHLLSLDETNRKKEDLQNQIAEKGRELRAVYDRLEEKEKELKEHKMEVEKLRMRLEEVNREVGEKTGRIRELERERAELNADLQFERRRAQLEVHALATPIAPRCGVYLAPLHEEESNTIVSSVVEKENRDLSPLESEINDARKRDSATRAKAVEQDEAEKVETEKEQLHKGTLMESGIHDNILKEMQNLLVQCLDEANREKETLQNEITEKERELSSAKDEKVELYTQLQSEKKRVAQLEIRESEIKTVQAQECTRLAVQEVQVSCLENKLLDERTRAKDMQEVAKRLEEKNELLQRKVQQTESEIQALNMQHLLSLDEANREKEHLQNQMDEKERELRIAYHEEKESKMQVERMVKKLEEADREVEQWIEKLERERRRVEVLERDDSELRAVVKALKEEVEKGVSEFYQQLLIRKSENEELVKRVQIQEAHVSYLEKALNDERRRSSAYRARATKAEKAARGLEGENEQLQREIHALRMQHAQSLSREKEDLQTLMTAKQRELRAVYAMMESETMGKIINVNTLIYQRVTGFSPYKPLVLSNQLMNKQDLFTLLQKSPKFQKLLAHALRREIGTNMMENLRETNNLDQLPAKRKGWTKSLSEIYNSYWEDLVMIKKSTWTKEKAYYKKINEEKSQLHKSISKSSLLTLNNLSYL